MWVIRGGDKDRSVDRFTDQGMVALEFPQVPDAEILTRTEIRRFLVGDLSPAALDAQVAVLSAFIRELQVGDSVLMPDPRRGEVVVGTVTGRYEFDDAAVPAERHRRTVEWRARHAIDDLPAPVRAATKQRPVLGQHRDAEWAGYLVQVRDGTLGRDPKDRSVASAAPARRRAPSTGATRVTKPVIAQRTCSACFLQHHPDRMRGDLCVDCAE